MKSNRIDSNTACGSAAKSLPSGIPLFSGLLKGGDYVHKYCVDFSPAIMG